MDDIDSRYEVPRTAVFLRSRAYTRVALQFPDEMLKDAPAVALALRRELGGGGVRVFVMADTAYNSCCVDEIGASHIDAQCVVHYGHACMSPTSNLPAFFVFGKAPLDVDACASSLLECSRKRNKRILVLYGLEYAYALDDLRRVVEESSYKSHSSNPKVMYADFLCSVMSPSSRSTEENECPQSNETSCTGDLSVQSEVATFLNNRCNMERSRSTHKYSLGGITWDISVEEKMEDYLIFWIGQDNSAFANIVLTFNKCEIVRYDAVANQQSADVSHLMKILRRRYYLVEKAKDANIIGILVGTLGVDLMSRVQ